MVRRDARFQSHIRRARECETERLWRRLQKHKEAKKLTARERQQRDERRYLKQRKDDRVAGRKPRDEIQPKKLVDIATRKNWADKAYSAALQRLSTYQHPTDEQKQQLSVARLRGPNYLGRTVSLTAGHKFDTFSSGTNGFTTQNLLMPAADSNIGEAVHADLAAMTQGEIIYMVGQHLMWNDIAGDEFLSYSIDPLFLVYHALGRAHMGQAGVTIQFIDRRQAQSASGEPAPFYHALDLYDLLGVRNWDGWKRPQQGALLPRKFTQEFLSHGTVKSDDLRFQQAKLGDLIRDGLFELFPAFKVADNEIRARLYSGQVILRTIGYPPPEVKRPLKRKRSDVQKNKDRRIYAYEDCPRVISFTPELLALVQKLTRNFILAGKGDDRNGKEPPLHIFLCFLTFEKRPRRDQLFTDWIRTHYNASDVTDIYTDAAGHVLSGFTDVADNLPGVMQYLDLLRDAIHAFGLLELPANVVMTVNASTGRDYAGQDATHNRKGQLAVEYNKEKQRDDRDKAAKKRKEEKERTSKAKGEERKGAGVVGGKVVASSDASEAEEADSGDDARSEAASSLELSEDVEGGTPLIASSAAEAQEVMGVLEQDEELAEVLIATGATLVSEVPAQAES